tara:strand:- start:26 stop:418 length:393 start_codon:yes stop_codon:yes gene_type:complete
MAKVYWIDKDALAVADISSDNKTLSGPTAGTLSLHCSRHDAPFVKTETGATNSNSVRIEHGMTESPVIPVEYHEAICYKAIAHGYEKRLDTLPQAKYFLSKYEKAIASGKQEANTHKSEESSIVIQGREF